MRGEYVIGGFMPEDLDALMAIWLEANRSAHPFIRPQLWEERYQEVKAALPEAQLFVCRRQDEIVGFIGLADCQIAGLFVGEACRSRGVGRRLLEHCKALYPRLELEVFIRNHRAAAFYHKNGFNITDIKADGLEGEPEYLMTWTAE